MKKLENIDTSFTETIRNSDLSEVTIDFAENFMDSLFEEGLLKDLPIINTLFGISKMAINIKDKLFLKKIIYFLSGVNHISVEKRSEMIDQINDSGEHKIKVGEKLVYILDKCDDHITAKYIAQLFSALLEKKLNYSDFLKGSRIIQNIFLSDLECFIEADLSEFQVIGGSDEFPNEEQFPFINIGICAFGYNKTNINQNRYGENEINGGEAQVWLTEIGEKMKLILKKER